MAATLLAASAFAIAPAAFAAVPLCVSANYITSGTDPAIRDHPRSGVEPRRDNGLETWQSVETVRLDRPDEQSRRKTQSSLPGRAQN